MDEGLLRLRFQRALQQNPVCPIESPAGREQVIGEGLSIGNQLQVHNPSPVQQITGV